MIRILAQWWARRKYRWATELEAGVADLQAALSAQRAQQKWDLAAQLRKEAEGMETRVSQIAEMEEKGFFLCEYGHERDGAYYPGTDVVGAKCIDCGAPAKYIKRSEMTGQEKYESDKQRKDVETMIAEKRKLADQYATDAKGGDDTAKHFTRQAASSREVADRLRKL